MIRAPVRLAPSFGTLVSLVIALAPIRVSVMMGHGLGVFAHAPAHLLLRRALAFLLSSGDRDQLNQFRHRRGDALRSRLPARDGHAADAEPVRESRLRFA